MHRQELTKASAVRLVRKIDDRQDGFFRYAFQLDLESANLYDLVINMEKLLPDTAAAVIAQAARSEDISACSIHALDAMQRFSLQHQIRAELLESAIDVSSLSVEVPESGSVHIFGMAASQEDADRIPEIVRRVPGVNALACDLTVWTGAI